MLFQQKRNANSNQKYTLIKETLYYLLKRQISEVADFYLEDISRGMNQRAVGYCYGFIEAALRQSGIDPESGEGKHIFRSILDAFGDGRGEELISQMMQSRTGSPNSIRGIQAGFAEYDAWIKLGGTKFPSGLKACFAQ